MNDKLRKRIQEEIGFVKTDISDAELSQIFLKRFLGCIENDKQNFDPKFQDEVISINAGNEKKAKAQRHIVG